MSSSLPPPDGQHVSPRRGLGVTMYRVRRKCRQTYRHILGALRLRRAITYPFPRWRVHSLTDPHLQDICLRLDAEHACQHERELLECGRLPRLLPSWRTVHAGIADLVRVRVHLPDE